MNRSKKLVSIIAGIMAAIVLLSLLLGLLVSVASAATSSEIEEQIKELEKQMAEQEKKNQEIEDKLAENDLQVKSMADRKSGIDQQIALLYEQIITINQIISAYNLMIADKQDELDSSLAKLELMQEAYKDRIRAMEEQGDISYWSVIFQANSFSDLLDRLNMIAEIARSDRERMEQIRKLAQQVEETKAELDAQKAELELSKQELQETQAELEIKSVEAEGLLYALVKASEEYADLLDEGEKLASDYMDQLDQAEKDWKDAKYREWLATSVPPTTTSPAGLKTNTVNGIVWYTPLKSYTITSKFGLRSDPFTGKLTGHDGLDMAAPKNTPIYATRAGVVSFAGYQEGGAGYYVWINHGDGFKSIYMHMTRYVVEEGQTVEAGELIGYVGSTGRSTGNHLHFGIKYNSTYVDPQKYIKT